jgi:hypothetical protein
LLRHRTVRGPGRRRGKRGRGRSRWAGHATGGRPGAEHRPVRDGHGGRIPQDPRGIRCVQEPHSRGFIREVDRRLVVPPGVTCGLPGSHEHFDHLGRSTVFGRRGSGHLILHILVLGFQVRVRHCEDLVPVSQCFRWRTCLSWDRGGGHAAMSPHLLRLPTIVVSSASFQSSQWHTCCAYSRWGGLGGSGSPGGIMSRHGRLFPCHLPREDPDRPQRPRRPASFPLRISLRRRSCW